MADHLVRLRDLWGCGNFYLSQDAFLPATARNLALALREAGPGIRWSTDMRPEKDLTPECCADLKAGGALSMALGIESASPRVLKLIDKGIPVERMRRAVENLARAGIAVEAMCFNAFPTETPGEALETLAFIRDLEARIALFICGRFGLWHGSRVALHPERYGIRRIWQLDGDEMGTGLFHETLAPARSARDQERVDRAIDGLSGRWWLHDYPWAGALSTAHTLLWYARKGPGVFRAKASTPRHEAVPAPPPVFRGRYDMERMAERAQDHEARIWDTLIRVHGAVGAQRYHALADALPRARPQGRKGAGRGRRRTPGG
jgi:hypothetical protein